jgi:Ca2+-binding EF-hand superfamily protein
MKGFITIASMTKYLKDDCGYHITEDEQKLLLNRYDRDKDYKVDRDEFNYMVDYEEEEEGTEYDPVSSRPASGHHM